MTRTERIHKLANAIREYRGRTSTPAGTPPDEVRWVTPPKPMLRQRVVDCLKRLNLDVTASMEAIDAFPTFKEFEAFLNRI